LLAPVAAPVAAVVGSIAVEAGKDVEGVDGGHVVLREFVDRLGGYRRETTAKLIASQRRIAEVSFSAA
jgi:hypothetical protein